jgi:hypothetical protein
MAPSRDHRSQFLKRLRQVFKSVNRPVGQVCIAPAYEGKFRITVSPQSNRMACFLVAIMLVSNSTMSP